PELLDKIPCRGLGISNNPGGAPGIADRAKVKQDPREGSIGGAEPEVTDVVDCDDGGNDAHERYHVSRNEQKIGRIPSNFQPKSDVGPESPEGDDPRFGGLARVPERPRIPVDVQTVTVRRWAGKQRADELSRVDFGSGLNRPNGPASVNPNAQGSASTRAIRS